MSRRLLLLPLALVFLVGATTAVGGPSASDEPTDVDALSRALDEAALRLGQVAELARRDERYREIELYKSYSEKEFKARGSVTAEDLVKMVSDKTAPKDLREKAAQALMESRARNTDPDLAEKAPNGRKPRAYFAKTKLIKLLGDDDVTTRVLVSQILNTWYRGAEHDPDIGMFNPEHCTSRDVQKAKAAWNKAVSR